jgi:hypothetical protein
VKNAGESSLSDVLSRDSFGEGPDDGTQKFSEPSQEQGGGCRSGLAGAGLGRCRPGLPMSPERTV